VTGLHIKGMNYNKTLSETKTFFEDTYTKIHCFLKNSFFVRIQHTHNYT